MDLVLLHHLDLTEGELIRSWGMLGQVVTHLFQLLAPLHIGLESDSRKDDANHEPLRDVEDMAVGKDRQEDSEQFPGDGDGDEGERSKLLEGIKDEALAQCAADTE